ncbi:hypothetical protein CHL76_02185 [Marinococcus halophilus]|uniref:Uncharacterized protein n=1 Tax=Marinococcus halophilus TaxID=1371 RepID=A0A510Y1C9_MARHA|nr:hypothetical protein [Marinococcus halophilus]OZT81185.1 hypothetical protein CHL76_02185 [Marinococcus halophilus]GEK57118.1 hypothetical protein MHA01_00230 [Marinococcus halophilus]
MAKLVVPNKSEDRKLFGFQFFKGEADVPEGREKEAKSRAVQFGYEYVEENEPVKVDVKKVSKESVEGEKPKQAKKQTKQPKKQTKKETEE